MKPITNTITDTITNNTTGIITDNITDTISNTVNDTMNWAVRVVGTEQWVPASVPGSVYKDYLRAGCLEDPFWRDNEEQALAFMDHDFEYLGTFDVSAREFADVSADADEVLLRFLGLDTLADVFLNDIKLGSVNNMHRTWEYPVKELLREGHNELRILFHSPVRFIAEAYEQDPAIQGTEDAMRGFPKIRKAHYMFGWDWGPRLPDAGIFRPIEWVKARKARLTSVYIRQQFSEDYSSVTLQIDTQVDTYAAAQKDMQIDTQADRFGENMKYDIRICIMDPDGVVICDQLLTDSDSVTIDRPRLWWPNGLGGQPLYAVCVELEDSAGVTLDSWERRIGLRSMTMSTRKDAYGQEFAHMVNGVRFFAMGADYIPEDNLLSRMTPQRTRDLLEQCKAAHFNCIRVWGGGFYPSDAFYDACDELGLVVWQDFMFACANYRLTREFEDNILAELRDNVRRLRHHASLGLWCGNNEMEMFVDQGEWGAVHEIRSDYVKMYEYLFPRLLETEDPDRFYWPASPSSGGGFDFPNDPDRGDVHYWEVWHGSKPFTEYRKFHFRYLSEFGFQSLPSIRTIESFTLPEDRNVFSYVMEKHQRNASANGKIMNYMEQTFLYPGDLDTLIYASQLLQAEAIRYGVEHFRRNRGRCMGTVYWQLNDCWPVASWSSIDYYGRWKALHYYAKRFFAPLLISCEEEGMLAESLNVNAQPHPVTPSIRLNVANESMSDRCVSVCWQIRTAGGDILREECAELQVPALSSQWMEREALDQVSMREQYVSYQLLEQGRCVSEGTVLLCPPKYFRFQDPKLQVECNGDEIIVRATAFAKSIEIRNERDDLVLSDNFFDMNGGEKRVRILKGEPAGLSVRSVYDIR